jgi:hypothetical protein
VRTIALSLIAVIFAPVCDAGMESRPKSTWYSVNVHVKSKVVQAALVRDSEGVATTIFAKIRVQLSWRTGHLKQRQSRVVACAGNSTACDITVEIMAKAPPTVNGAALATAKPYAASGVRISIFFDRIAPFLEGHHAPGATILGYVMAHEIAHVLQGGTRHTEAGIMRPRWTDNDFTQMGHGALTFTREDVELIRRRLMGGDFEFPTLEGYPILQTKAICGTCLEP